MNQMGLVPRPRVGVFLAAAVAAALLAPAARAVAAPVITSMSAHNGPVGSSVVLTGSELAGTTSVTFGGGFGAVFTEDSPTQITATVPAGASAGAITVVTPTGTATSPLPFYPGATGLPVIGPVFPPPLGHSFGTSSPPNDGSISRASGQTFFIANVTLAQTRLISFGPQPGGVRLSFKDPNHASFGEVLVFDPSLSNLPGGVAVWVGQTSFVSFGPVYTRFTMTATDNATNQPVPLVAAADLGLSPSIGALHGMMPNQTLRLHHRFDASYNPTSGFVPALDLFDGYAGAKTTAFSSYFHGYYYDNLPPRLTVNTGLVLAQGGSQPIDQSKLRAVDLDGSDSETVYTVGPGGVHQGTLFKGPVALAGGSTFTQQDVNAGLISYTHDNSCFASDSFTFGAVDAHGGVMRDGDFTVFNFNIAVVLANLPPTGQDATLNVGLGAAASSVLSASNADCITPTYTFTVVSPPSKGTITALNPATGAFTYTATAGQLGADSFTYSVNDGVHESAPATISITIENQPPVVDPQTVSTAEGVAVGGTLTATDPDLPAQPITFQLGTDGSRGTAIVSGTGFTYTPAPDRFGADTFTVVANDGIVDSAPQTITVNITPELKVGRTLVSNNDADPAKRGVLLADPDSADFAPVALGGTGTELHGVALGRSGAVVVSGGDLTLYRVDTGVAVPLASLDPSPPFGPIGVAVEASGNLLVGQMTAGVGRYSPAGSPLTGYTGGLLQVVVGVVLAPNGDIYVSDIGVVAGGNNKIVKIDPSSGTQVLVAGGGLLNAGLPVDLARAETGEIYVAMGVSGPAAILKITPEGTVSALPTGTLVSAPTGITFGRSGELIVADEDGELIKVDPVTGAQTPFLADGPFTAPAGARRIEPLDLIFEDGFQ